MVKTYLRYKDSGVFGLINSSSANSCFKNNKIILAPALESVILWDWKRGVPIAKWTDSDNQAEVSYICPNPNGVEFAVGYQDGTIRIWDARSNSSSVTFTGHKSAVTALTFDAKGERLASGSKDTVLIIWDMLEEKGLYRLKGHKDQITGLVFLPNENLNHIVSTSKDTLMKVWDLETQHCVETIVAHRSEVWGLACSVDGSCLFTGAVDQELRVWNINPELLAKKLEHVANDHVVDDIVVKDAITLKGILERTSKERVLTIRVHPDGRFVAVQAADKNVEIFKFRNAEEIKKRMARKKKRLREKNQDNQEEIKLTFADEIVNHCIVRASGKIRSFDFAPSHLSTTANTINKSDTSFSLMCALANNSIELYSSTSPEDEDAEQDAPESVKLLTCIDLQGHRSDIRCLALSSDDELIASGSNNSIKIWNAISQQCIKTIESGYALCCSFVPGNKHLIVGTKTGEIQIFDLQSSTLLESIQAHQGPVWSLEIRPDKAGFTTGSADKLVKFWNFEFIEDGVKKNLTATHTRSLKMSEDVLCIRHSPDGRMLAVSLLDSTVKVFFYDTLKFAHSLYGHKLPVLAMDISSDSAIIATASADKSVKIWGLDFGDCHRSIYAHTDSVMACKFVWGTHYLFSVGKDKCLKYWDGDKFEQIMKLEGHHGEIWALAVGKFGNFVVTGSHDRSIRVWEKTEEPLYLEEEREAELERQYERSTLKDDTDGNNAPIGSGADDGTGDLFLDPSQAGEIDANGDEVGAAASKTSATLKSGEKIMEALDIWKSEREQLDIYHNQLEKGLNPVKPSKSPFILALNKPDMTPETYVLHVVSRVPSADLEQSLMVLPFSQIESLLRCINVWSEMGLDTILTSRILTFITKVHFNQLTSSSSSSLKPILQSVRENTRLQLTQWKDMVGFNHAGLSMLLKAWKGRHVTEFGESEDVEEKEEKENGKNDKGGKKKRKRVVISSQQ